MSKIYTYDYWLEHFKPMKNPTNDWGGDYSSWETYGEDVQYVIQQDDKNVWTEVDGDEGSYLVAGYHLVNRIQYYICQVPWDDDMAMVPVQLYRMCDCLTEDNDYEYDPECNECDEGTIDIPCDTVLDLKAVYGEEAEIIG